MPSKTAPDETEQWQYMEHHMYKYRVVHSTQQVKGHWETGAPHNPAQGIRLQGLTLSQRTYRATGGGGCFFLFIPEPGPSQWMAGKNQEVVPKREPILYPFEASWPRSSKLPGQGIQSFLAKE